MSYFYTLRAKLNCLISHLFKEKRSVRTFSELFQVSLLQKGQRLEDTLKNKNR